MYTNYYMYEINIQIYSYTQSVEKYLVNQRI